MARLLLDKEPATCFTVVGIDDAVGGDTHTVDHGIVSQYEDDKDSGNKFHDFV